MTTTPRKPRRNQGLAQRSDGRYLATLTVKDALGRRRIKCFYGDTSREALKVREEYKRALARGAPVDPERMPIEQYLDEWLKGDAGKHVKAHVLPSYAQAVRLYIAPLLGHLPLCDVTTPYVQTWLEELSADGLAPATVSRARGVLQSALGDAHRRGLIAYNPAQGTRSPSADKQEMQFWTPDETKCFLALIAGHPMEAYYVISLTIGPRISEVLGLRWKDVDFERGTLTIKQTLQRSPVSAPVIAGTKRRSSERTVRMPKAVISALTAYHERQEESQKRKGDGWQNGKLGLVFVTGNGTPYNQSNIRRQFEDLTEKAMLKQIRIHDMRHTAATLMILSGANISIVSKTLGHASIRITLDIYGHLLDEQKQEVADAMDRLLESA